MPSTREATDEVAPGGLRALTEWLVLLALAVTLLRGFAVEGYMISTGSMAPSLLGYHARVTCPSCGLIFAHGVAPPTASAAVTAEAAVSHAETGPDWLTTLRTRVAAFTSRLRESHSSPVRDN